MLSLLKFLDVTCDEIAIHFVSKRQIAKLHAIYFQDPTPTDTISFPLDNEIFHPHLGHHLGEVFVCPAVAQEYAKERELNSYLEATLYLVHGILHLIGYDDLTPKDKRKMRQKEKACMKHLQKEQVVLKKPRKK